MMKYVYIAGPYISHKATASERHDQIDQHIMQAQIAAIALSEHGIGFFCPHTHTAHFEEKSKAPESFYREVDEYFLVVCDAIYLLPGWENSTGSKAEREIAISLGLRVFTRMIDILNEWGVK